VTSSEINELVLDKGVPAKHWLQLFRTALKNLSTEMNMHLFRGTMRAI